jgi:hypothetical protein
VKIDEETVRRLAELAQVPIEADRRGLIAEGLEQFQALSDSWADLALSFRFEDGTFSYVPWVAQYRPEWSVPTPLNKHRVASAGEDG